MATSPTIFSSSLFPSNFLPRIMNSSVESISPNSGLNDTNGSSSSSEHSVDNYAKDPSWPFILDAFANKNWFEDPFVHGKIVRYKIFKDSRNMRQLIFYSIHED